MSISENTNPDYDLIVLGGGPVGENVADYATRNGLRVALIEAELVGGECSYWACMPSKALLRSGQALRAARTLPGAREAITGALNAQAVFARRTAFTNGWKDDSQSAWVQSAGIDLIRGRGSLEGPGRVRVGERVYVARAIALATGSVAHLPDIPGLAGSGVWGTREITSTDQVPPRLIILGSGVAGTEMACAFADLGSRVTLLSRGALLNKEEPFVAEHVAAGLTAAGVDIRHGVEPTQIDRDAHGIVNVALNDGTSVQGEQILVATGRRPATHNLGLEPLGVSTKFTVDDTMLVEGTDWLYAVGDVNGRALLTHQGKYQARVAGEAIAARLNGTALDDGAWGQHVATADHHAVPRVVFTNPQVAAVGLTHAQACDAGLNVRTVEYDIAQVAGASLHAQGYRGHAMLIIDEDRQLILGATFVGQDVSELLHAATIAITGQVPLHRLWHAVPAYPTISEIWLRLLETYYQDHTR